MKKTAFTMIEMIFVIVILGIVAGMTFIQISSVYEDMMQKQNSGELESEVKVVLEQITARLSSSIKDSLVAMTSTNGVECVPVSGPLNKNKTYILAWVGKSDEANLGLWDETLGDYRPDWSGFVDVNGSSMTSISTPGSKLSDAEKIIDQLIGQPNPYSLSQTRNSPVAIYFAGSGSNTNACSEFFNQTAYKMYQVKKNGDTRLDIIGPNIPTEISEQYTLSHSAYAIAKNGTDLYLYSFRPWLSEYPDHPNAKKYLLAKDVTGFGFKWSGGLFRVNICVGRTLNGFPIEVCKEKAVF
jgi:prepilin-type N-terminal cleavage/methylation domain-containing protein